MQTIVLDIRTKSVGQKSSKDIHHSVGTHLLPKFEKKNLIQVNMNIELYKGQTGGCACTLDLRQLTCIDCVSMRWHEKMREKHYTHIYLCR